MSGFELKGIPAFYISDYLTAKEFYVDFLGCEIDWEHRPGQGEPVYLQLSNNGLILHLSENRRFKKGMIVFVETKGVEYFHQQLIMRNKKDRKIPDISITLWDTKQLEIEDPFGNLLRFNENLG